VRSSHQIHDLCDCPTKEKQLVLIIVDLFYNLMADSSDDLAAPAAFLLQRLAFVVLCTP